VSYSAEWVPGIVVVGFLALFWVPGIALIAWFFFVLAALAALIAFAGAIVASPFLLARHLRRRLEETHVDAPSSARPEPAVPATAQPSAVG
jgi:membrane protein implicated in regulation of membrane protease activity